MSASAAAYDPRVESPTADALDAVRDYITSYIVLAPEEADAIALWTFHTHADEAAASTPYLRLTSATPGCGKSVCLEALQFVVRDPLLTMNVSDASLYHAIEEDRPTFMFDETDGTFTPGERRELASLLKAGYRRGGPKVLRMEGEGSNRRLRRFDVYCPKAFAGLKNLDPALSDRCVTIVLKRKRRTDRVQEWRADLAEPRGEQIRGLIESALASEFEHLVQVPREYLSELPSPRAREIWTPLLQIADLAGDDWPERARAAAIALSGSAEHDDSRELGVRLLADVRRVFDDLGRKRVSSAELAAALAADEEAPWSSWGRRQLPLTMNELARLLRPFGIRSNAVHVPGVGTVRGYKREQFEDDWSRYLI